MKIFLAICAVIVALASAVVLAEPPVGGSGAGQQQPSATSDNCPSQSNKAGNPKSTAYDPELPKSDSSADKVE